MKTLLQVVMGAFLGIIFGFILEAMFWDYAGCPSVPTIGTRLRIPGSNSVVTAFLFGPLLGILLGVVMGLCHRKLTLNRFLSYLTLGCAVGVVAGVLIGGPLKTGFTVLIDPPVVDPSQMKGPATASDVYIYRHRNNDLKWGFYIGAGLGTIAGIAMYYCSQTKPPSPASAQTELSELEKRS